MQYIMMFPPKRFIHWYIDEHGFLDLELIDLSDDT